MTSERRDVLHSWCVQAEWDAPTVTGGTGAFFHDENGRRYLDMSSLAECTTLGHQHPAVVRAIRDQAEKLCFVTAAWGAEPRARLAEQLLEKSGFTGGRVFFTLGGADANEHAVKFARQARRKPRGWVVGRDRSYHGASYATMAFSRDARTQHLIDAAEWRAAHVPSPYAYRCPFGSASEEECAERAARSVGEAIDARGADEVAAVLMEPNAGTNGIVPPDRYWTLLREETRRRGVLLIADEVMSAFGRCGEWFAWQRHGEAGRPDIMTLAKGLTGAHVPLGAVVLSRKVAAHLEGEMLPTGLTYCGHPLACAAGVAALRAYEDEGLIERSRILGARMLAMLREVQERVPAIGDVRGGHGLFAVVELVKDRTTREPVAAWPQVHPALRAFVERGREAGVSFAVQGNLVILAPPLVIGEADLTDALGLMERLLMELSWS
ncbi:MAG: aminotransferase class III-fold pyridoxal phosphate-dependent enzyme [Acidobacteria bacterium]|jgi:taurine--2-oxoglutarate transaminase|nr:aminotransferase class III-fold pyridoxal phosphate-dependent enzyme [Acidobacteriota bacterium]